MRKKGFSLAEMLITIGIVAVVAMVTIPLITIRQKIKNFDASLSTCIRSESAASITANPDTPGSWSTACSVGVENLQGGVDNALNTVDFLMNSGSDTEKSAAKVALFKACDNGGAKACQLIVTACQKDADACDDGTDYDLEYYLSLMPEDSDNSSKFLVAEYAKTLYNAKNPNIRNIVDDTCHDACVSSNYTDVNMACYAEGESECTYNFRYPGPYNMSAGGPDTFFLDSGSAYISNQSLYKIDRTTGDLDYAVSYGLFYPTFIKGEGNFLYSTGYRWVGGNYNTDLTVMKINKSDGSVVYSRNYDWYEAGTPTIMREGASNGMVLYGDSIYGIASFHYYPDGDDDYYRKVLVSFDKETGDINWVKYMPLAADDNGTAQLLLYENYLYFIRQVSSGSNVFIVKIDPSTATTTEDGIVWEKELALDLGAIYEAEIAMGYLYLSGWDSGYLHIFKIDFSSFESLWDKEYDSNAGTGIWTDIFDIKYDSGYLYVCGSYSNDGTINHDDVYVMKLSLDGDVIWTKTFGSADYDLENVASVFISDNYIYGTKGTGGISDPPNDSTQSSLIKMNINQESSTDYYISLDNTTETPSITVTDSSYGLTDITSGYTSPSATTVSATDYTADVDKVDSNGAGGYDTFGEEPFY